MENLKKCSNKKHSELNAVSYCLECSLYLCNKCTNYHIEYLDTHHIYNLDKDNPEIFTGLCQEVNHKNKLEYYCKNHNELCCAACLCKIKSNGNGQHSECKVCEIREIKEEKKKKLNENIQNLEELSKNIEESIKKLKEIYEKINENKEEIKLKISNIFTKIRNIINEREDQLLKELDILFDNSYFKEDVIKNGEKMPKQIKIYLEKGKLINNEWKDDSKLIERINDCINIEKNIQNIFEINESIKTYNSKKISFIFSVEESKFMELENYIKKFGEIINDEIFKFKFKPGNNYDITNNGLIATKNCGGDNFNCLIIGDKEIPKDRISRWKIKINKNKNKSKNLDDYYIGIGPKSFKGYSECWSLKSTNGKIKVKLKLKFNDSDYSSFKEDLKEGDIIEVIVDRKLGNLSFSINDINYGIACSNIPKNEELYPTILLFEQGLSVEIV